MIAVGSAQDLLARASSRNRLEPADARAGAVFERVTVDGESFFVKRLSASSDWIMRIAGDHVHRPYVIWRSGLMDHAPGLIDHTVVSMDLTGPPGDDAVLTIVMRDVGESLVPPGDSTVPAAQHARFIAHMAALSSAFWGWEDRIGLTTMAQRMRFFAPGNIAAELDAAEVPGPLAAAAAGWPALAERSPLLSAVARCVHDDPEILTARLSGLPGTFLHGDWKMGRQPGQPPGRAHGPAGLDPARRRTRLLGSVLVPGAQPGQAAGAETGGDRPVPRRAGKPRDRHRGLVARTARLVPDRDHGHVRLGEGARRRRRAVLVGDTGHRGGHPPAHPVALRQRQRLRISAPRMRGADIRNKPAQE